jgi:uncharacterized protein YyaL (SSP411 family)
LWDPAANAFRGGEPSGPLAPGLWVGAFDSELPSPQGVLAGVLLRLGRLTGEPRYERLARRLFATFERELSDDPVATRTLSAARAGLPSSSR